jgi:hypothetical protein
LGCDRGVEREAWLARIVFMMHTQQINKMDKSNGKTVSTIAWPRPFCHEPFYERVKVKRNAGGRRY